MKTPLLKRKIIRDWLACLVTIGYPGPFLVLPEFPPSALDENFFLFKQETHLFITIKDMNEFIEERNICQEHVYEVACLDQ